MQLLSKNEDFIVDVKLILDQARQKAYSAVNTAMVEGYWLVGKRIVEEEQQGKERAEYGKEIIKSLAKELTSELGKGFSLSNIKNFRQFYLTFPDLLLISQTVSGEFQNQKSQTVSGEFDNSIRQTVSAESPNGIWQTVFAKLSWSHYQTIMRVPNKEAQTYYLKEAAENMWSVRTLERNIATLYYDRLLLSQIKKPVIEEMLEKTQEFQNDKFEFIKNPAVLEFLNLPANTGYTEAELEKALIDNIQKFILELGKGFAFVERQQLIRTETKDYFIDLVFYNYLLKCFVIIDLKTAPITHQDVGQMDMYVRMYDEIKKSNDDNPTLGIVLCTETDSDIVRYSILKGNEQIFATKYKLYLPTAEELRAEIEREMRNINLQLGME